MTAALAIRPDMGIHEIGGALIGIGICTGDHNNVAVIVHSDPTLRLGQPGQQGFGAAIVVDQRTAEAAAGHIGQGAMQQIAVKEDNRTGLYFHRNCVFITIRGSVPDVRV